MALFGFAVTLLSAHWVRRPRWRVAVRAVGLGVAGLGVWLAAGWFGDQLPEEARPWAARAVVSRVLAVTGLLFVAWTCWFRPAAESPHRRWAVRTLAVPALALAVVFGLHWFGRSIWEEIPIGDAIQVTVALAAVATGTCGMIAAGAYLLRDRAARRSVRRRTAANSMPTPEATTDRPLPIAVLLDDRGRPILPLPPR